MLEVLHYNYYLHIFCSKAINKAYEEYVLTEGDFDERVFLCDDADVKLGTPIKRQLQESRKEQNKKDVLDHLAAVINVKNQFMFTVKE